MNDLHKLSVVIPAAGQGRRMKSYGPKALVKLGEETLIARQLRLVRALLPEARVVVVLGHEAERIQKTLPGWVRVVFNADYETTGVARSIGLGLEACRPGPALVVYGDLVFNQAALRELIEQPGSAVLVDTRGQLREEEVGVSLADARAHHFCFGLATRWSHVVKLSAIDRFRFENLALAPAADRHYGYEVLNAILGVEGNFAACEPAEGRIVEVDSAGDILAARAIVEMGD